MDICRFRGIDDSEYTKVAAAVHRIVERVVVPTQRWPALKTRILEPPPITQGRQTDLEDSLKFAQFNERKRAIRPAHEDTCRWILEDVQYLSWLCPKGKDRDNYFMWIKGKPGTGKSTLMKLICSHADETIPDSAVISFFFHARGADLEKSTTGLYRSLLLQMMSTQTCLQSVLDYVPLIAPTQTESVEWTNDILKELIGYAIRGSKQRIICFIDALDECSEEQIRDMISFLYGIIKTDSSQTFSVCFSSRHYPHISIPAGQQLVLESREDHKHDIATYLGCELRIGSSSRSERIKAEIIRRSSGIFVWVVLVISILNREYGKGRVHLLQKRLREIPGSLYELFSDLVTRDTEDLDDMILCLRWTLFSARPLTLEELYFAMMSKLSRQDWDLLDMDDISSQDMERFIVNASKGLVEATGTAHLPIQFIHETVRDFLLDERATSRLLPQLDGNFLGRSHEVLRDLCLATLNLAFKADGKTLKPSSNFEARVSHPFLDYATEYVLYHSNAAQIAGISQQKFLQSFPLHKWLTCESLLRGLYTPKAHLLYILADKNYAALVAVDPQCARHMEIRGEEFGLPVLAAICRGHSGLANTLLHDCNGAPDFDPRVLADEYNPGFLIITAKYGTIAAIEAIRALWPREAFNLDYVDDSNRTLLMHAVCHENMEVVEHLLDRGADPDIQDDEGQTAFHVAVKTLNLAMVQCLTNHGAKLTSTNAGMTELLEVAFNTGAGHRKKQREIFFFLLSAGTIGGLDISEKQASLWLGMDLARLEAKLVQDLAVRSRIKTTVEYVAEVEQKVLRLISI